MTPDRTAADFYIRYPDEAYLAQVTEFVDNAAKAAALSTGTKVKIDHSGRNRAGIGVATLSYVDGDYNVGSDNGLALGGGVRSRLGESFEVDAGLKYVDLDESDTGLHVGARYYFNDTMALGASIDDNDNADTLRLGFRWEF